MSAQATERLIAEYRKTYPPLITIDDAAAIARVPVATVYDWSSRGLLDGIKSKRGRRLLIDLHGFINFLLSEEH